MDSLGTGWVWRQWKKSLFTSPGSRKNDIIWKSLGGIIENRVPREVPKFWSWYLPRYSIHHDTPLAFPNNVPVARSLPYHSRTEHWLPPDCNPMQDLITELCSYTNSHFMDINRKRKEQRQCLAIKERNGVCARIEFWGWWKYWNSWGIESGRLYNMKQYENPFKHCLFSSKSR